MFDVVIPLFNKERFIAATIESVVRQRFTAWRLYVVDDGSTDGSAEVACRFDDPRITVLRQTNSGVGPARNTGIEAGSSPWIAFLDADDIWREDHLEELDALRRQFPKAVLIGSKPQKFSGSGAAPRPSGEAGGTRRLARYFRESAGGEEIFITSSAAVRRSALDEVGLFKPLPGNEDVELWARLALHGPIAVSSRRTIFYRTDIGGLSQTALRPPAQSLRREDLSSTIPTLTERLPGITDPQLRDDIIRYMDSRISLALVAAVRSGRLADARRLLPLYFRGPRGKARLVAAIARLPSPIASGIVAAGLAMKRASRLARN